MLLSFPSAAALKILLCFVLPLMATTAFYLAEQQRLRRATQEVPAALTARPQDVTFALELNQALDRKRHRIAGWVADNSGAERRLIWPSVLVVAPAGNAVEFRVNLRRLGDKQASIKNVELSGFEVDLKNRELPAGWPLKLFLVIQRAGRRELVDTGAFVGETRP